MFFSIFVLAFKEGFITKNGTLVHKVFPPVTDILPSQTSTFAYKSDIWQKLSEDWPEYCQENDSGFTDIPTAFYWVIITMTTVG